MLRLVTQYSPIFFVAFGLVVSQLLLKQGLKGSPPLSITSPADLVAIVRHVLGTPVLIAGYSLSGLTGLMWLVVISRFDISFATPLMNGIFYALLLAASALLLGEAVTPPRLAGVLLVVSGIALLARTA